MEINLCKMHIQLTICSGYMRLNNAYVLRDDQPFSMLALSTILPTFTPVMQAALWRTFVAGHCDCERLFCERWLW